MPVSLDSTLKVSISGGKKEGTPYTKVVNAAKTTLPIRYSLPGQICMGTESGDQSREQRSMTEE